MYAFNKPRLQKWISFVFLGLGWGTAPSVAQVAVTPELTAPRFVMITPGYHIPLPFRVRTGPALREDLAIEIRGVPAGLSFSSGENFGNGTWRLSAQSIPQATLHASHLAEARMALSISLVGQPRIPQAQIANPDHNRFISNARRMLDEGQVVHARRFLERAANSGSAEAALLLASTYDANELARWNVLGLTANPAEAQRWRTHAQSISGQNREAVLARTEVTLVTAAKELLPKHPKTDTKVGAWKTEVHVPSARAAPSLDVQKKLLRGAKLIPRGRFGHSNVHLRPDAEAGLTEAPLKSARTYDGRVIAKLQARGSRPDERQARQRYAIGHDLGATLATEIGFAEALMNH